MLAGQRRLKILEMLREEGSCEVKRLSSTFNVTEPTIRQDLEVLESEGLIVREHGGAYLKNMPEQVKNLTLQNTENMDKKCKIGKKAAEFIQDGDSIILDAGSTNTEIAKNIMLKKDLTVITNALNIALLLGSQHSFTIMMTGGQFKPPTLSLTGEKASCFFEHIYVNKLFLATGGIATEVGLTYPGINDLQVKRSMTRSAETIFVVADSTKIGKVLFASLDNLDSVRYLITDEEIREEDCSAFRKLGITVIIAR